MEQHVAVESQLSSDAPRIPGVVVIAPDHRVMWVNQALCELVGDTPAGLCGRLIDDIVHYDDVSRDALQLFQLFAGESASYHAEKRLLRRDGTAITVRWVASSIRDRLGRAVYVTAQVEGKPDLQSGQADPEMEKIRRAILG